MAFTAIFETLHTIPTRAVIWLLKFLWCLFTVLGQYSDKISAIAKNFPSTIYKRAQYLKKTLAIPSVRHMVVCPHCYSIFEFEECTDKCGSRTTVRDCPECYKRAHGKRNPLLKQIVSQQGRKRFYPHLVYPVVSLISSLQGLISRPGFLDNCEHWRATFNRGNTSLRDVYDGKVWENFMEVDSQAFLSEPNSLGLMLNFDFFQPFKHKTYSIGVLYLVVMNLPRNIRFKRENLIIVGIIPGPHEPSLTINTFLTPLVSELISLWGGLPFKTYSNATVRIRCALLCVACDMPAARKVSGFLSFKANLGCSRCYCNFGTGIFGKQDFSGFDCDKWVPRSVDRHRRDIELTLRCLTKTARERKESEIGCRYSCLLQLPYFDPIKMTIIDPMHNLYLCTAKTVWSLYRKLDIITDSDLAIINSRLTSLRIPSNVSFSSLPEIGSSKFTAEQWMIWINYYSVFCLYDLLDKQHFECWRSFVLASRLLCKASVTKDDITVANCLLVHFCRRFQTIYGKDAVTPNMHMQCHLAECVRDFGPIASFWCFSFERFNGLLGDLPTNNRSIELQVMKRFISDNSHFQLLSHSPACKTNLCLFQQTVTDHAFQFYSTKHLDCHVLSNVSHFSTGFQYVPARKYTLAVFSQSQLDLVKNLYHIFYPSLVPESVIFTQSYRKILSVTINDQVFRAGQYALAENMGSSTTCTASNPSLVRPAKLWYFAIHSVNTSESEKITHGFAIVSWPMIHPDRNALGKPFEVWCWNLFDSNPSLPKIIPLDSIRSFLLTTSTVLHHETLLLTVPLV